MRLRYPPAALGKRRRAGGTADHRFSVHATTLAVRCADRDTGGGPGRARRRARYCFHDSL
jgi:hypothetical protein